MAGSWLDTTIGDQVRLQRGFDITKLTQSEGKVPVVSTAGVLSYHDTAMAKGPGVILGRKGNGIGRAHFVSEDYWPHDTTLWVTDFKGNDPKFVFYFFRQQFTRLQSMDVGSANPTLNRNHVHPIAINWPPLAEQKAIAAVLGALDDKIELNRQMNETLEAMARALFQSWFVDFDPVRAKLNGEGFNSLRLQREGQGFESPYLHLFPASFQHSEIGQIPKGWSAGKISHLATLNRVAINPGDFPTETFDHFSLPAFDNGRTPKVELGSAIMSNKFTVTPNSVLLSKLNPHIPRIWLPDINASRRSVCSTEFMVVCSKTDVSREYLFSLFTSSAFASVYGTLVTGTTGSHQRIRPESVLEMKTIIPPPALIRAFTEITQLMFDRVNRNTEQSRTLATLRDTLLSKLLSGELSVAERKH
ncbi:MAG: restriction endonuclease subunit S [Prosthecobacter sp.]